MSPYEAWVERLVRDHRHRQQGHGLRYSGCWACDVLEVGEEDRTRCRELSRGIVDGDHLLTQQTLRREFPHGVYVSGPLPLMPAGRPGDVSPELVALVGVDPSERVRGLEQLLYDPRVGVPMRRWHHDQRHHPGVRQLRVRREALPVELEEFAAELGLGWYLDRTYGQACSSCDGSGIDRSGGGLGELCPLCKGRR